MSAEKKISELTAVSGTLSRSEYFEVVQDGENKKLTLSDIDRLGDTWKYLNSYSVSAVPTKVVAAGAGVGASATIAGTNECGTITLTTGTGAGTGVQITVTLSGGFSFPSNAIVTLWAGSSSSAPIMTKLFSSVNSNSFTIEAQAALTDLTAYRIYYIVKGY